MTEPVKCFVCGARSDHGTQHIWGQGALERRGWDFTDERVRCPGCMWDASGPGPVHGCNESPIVDPADFVFNGVVREAA